MVKPEQVTEGIIAYAEGEILPEMDGWRIWAASAALALLRQRSGALAAELVHNRMIAAMGLVDAEGMIDLDAAVDALKQTARAKGKLPLDIPGVGVIKLGEDDFDQIKEYIKRAGA